jgi:hypothetical protein
MAFLDNKSFQPTEWERSNQPALAKDLDNLYREVRAVLRKISGPPLETSYGDLYIDPPRALRRGRDNLKSSWKRIWDDTIITHDQSESGAYAEHNDKIIGFGTFFARDHPPRLIEKVMWHEFLHLVIDVPRPMHHGWIDDVIKYHLKVPGHPNPLGTVGWSC